MMKRILKYIRALCVNCWNFFSFLFKTMFHITDYIHYSKLPSLAGKNVHILATGPSLTDALPLLLKEEKDNAVFMAMNFFALDESFISLKPSFYFLMDSMFFHKGLKYEQVLKTYNVLKGVSWDMILFIPSNEFGNHFVKDVISNPFIKISSITTNEFHGGSVIENFLYKKRFAAIGTNTVLFHCIQTAICMKPLSVNLYGVDHNFFDNLIMRNNFLCKKNSHFYDADSDAEYHIVRKADNTPFRTSEYFIHHASIFLIHDRIATFANTVGVKIFNCSKDSFIDSYQKKENI